tara:strand:+ start:260 stop:466 length:207 start_codon:yes stop_codon:yes gene_type:complete
MICVSTASAKGRRAIKDSFVPFDSAMNTTAGPCGERNPFASFHDLLEKLVVFGTQGPYEEMEHGQVVP